jgi:O-antigen/teichoic acid export membrane protein
MNRKGVLKDFFVYSTGSYVSQALGMVSGFLLRTFLEPYYMGIWQGLSIIKSYTSYTNLGVTKAAAREIAYFRGKGQNDISDEVKNVCFSFSFIMIIGVGAILASLALIFKNTLNPFVFWGLITMAFVVVLERVESLIVTMLRAYKKFMVESVGKIVTSIANVALILLLVKNFKLYGLYLTHILVFILSIFLLLGLSKLRFAFQMSREELKRLIKIGIPLVLLGFMFTNLTNVDRIVVIKMLGPEELGFYSIALMMGNLAYNVSNMAGIVLYPRFQEVYAKNDKREDVYGVMMKILRLIWLPLLVFTLIAIGALPFLVRWIIPKYILGISAMKVFIAGTYFLSLSLFCGHFLITINKQKYSIFVCSGTILLNLLLNIVFINRGWGIVGVATATSISYLVYFVGLFVTAAFFKKTHVAIIKGEDGNS